MQIRMSTIVFTIFTVLSTCLQWTSFERLVHDEWLIKKKNTNNNNNKSQCKMQWQLAKDLNLICAVWQSVEIKRVDGTTTTFFKWGQIVLVAKCVKFVFVSTVIGSKQIVISLEKTRINFIFYCDTLMLWVLHKTWENSIIINTNEHRKSYRPCRQTKEISLSLSIKSAAICSYECVTQSDKSNRFENGVFT